jgi:hypothetical protein
MSILSIPIVPMTSDQALRRIFLAANHAEMLVHLCHAGQGLPPSEHEEYSQELRDVINSIRKLVYAAAPRIAYPE